MLFHASMKRMTFCPLYHQYIITGRFFLHESHGFLPLLLYDTRIASHFIAPAILMMPANCSAAKQLPQFCKHSKSADLLRKSLLSHVWRVPSSKALSCKHERLFDLLTLASLCRIRLSIPRKCSIIGINSCTMQLSVCKEVFGKDGRVCERESVIND